MTLTINPTTTIFTTPSRWVYMLLRNQFSSEREKSEKKKKKMQMSECLSHTSWCAFEVSCSG